MKRSRFLILTLLLLGISCAQQIEKPEDHSLSQPEETLIELKSDTHSYLPRHEEFIYFILNDGVRKHDHTYVVENCKYPELFQAEGLKEIVAYSDKNYPMRGNPTDYEHFVLFCFKYSTPIHANESFDKLHLLTQLDPSTIETLDPTLIEQHKMIQLISKAGGLIVQQNECIYSLVETCRETPIGGNWADYENLFLSYILRNQNDAIDVLNADCGHLKFNFHSSKPQ